MSKCFWCGDESPEHKHYTVIIRESDGHLLGRLTPDGHTTMRKVYAAIMSRETAEQAALTINEASEYTATIRSF